MIHSKRGNVQFRDSTPRVKYYRGWLRTVGTLPDTGPLKHTYPQKISEEHRDFPKGNAKIPAQSINFLPSPKLRARTRACKFAACNSSTRLFLPKFYTRKAAQEHTVGAVPEGRWYKAAGDAFLPIKINGTQAPLRSA